MQHSRLFSSTRSSGVTLTIGSCRMARLLAGGGECVLTYNGSGGVFVVEYVSVGVIGIGSFEIQHPILLLNLFWNYDV